MTMNSAATGLVSVRVDLGALRRNWRFLLARARGEPPMAVVKGDAYGHGIVEVSRALLEEGCMTFAVGSVAEGVFLRRAFAGHGARHVRILPLLGVLDERDAAAVVAHGLLPLVHSPREAALLGAAHSGAAPLPVAVKVDTGMGRLGFRSAQMKELVAALRAAGNLAPVLLLSHLAAADDPAEDAAVADQVASFLETYATLRAMWPGMAASIANSAGHLAADALLAAMPPHVGRPGFALYGGNPFAGTARAALGAALEPVMAVSAPVLAVHDLAPGESVSYGRTFTAPAPMRVAVIGAGYADGFSRGLSGRGAVHLGGARRPVLGRVCMQMHMADVTHFPAARAGDEAFLLGGEGAERIGADELAGLWGTIPYEVFCMLGKNRRTYVAGDKNDA